MNTTRTLASLAVALFWLAGCTAATSDDSPSQNASDDNGPRGGLGKADGYGLPGACGDLTSGKSPDGCYCDPECCDFADCCSEDRMNACFGEPPEASSPIPRLETEAGTGKIVVNGTTAFSGTLQADGSAGMSYVLTAEEGYVCGQLYLTKWDPFNEGFSLDNSIAVRWLAPDGSVASSCAPEMRPLEGIYQGTSDAFQGTFTWAKAMPGDYSLRLEGGTGVLSFKGQAILQGALMPDGSAGMSYNLVAEEGFVCGSFYLTKWDPENEGNSLSKAINVQWRKPDGSVANTCGATYANASGIYGGDSDLFAGLFTK